MKNRTDRIAKFLKKLPLPRGVKILTEASYEDKGFAKRNFRMDFSKCREREFEVDNFDLFLRNYYDDAFTDVFGEVREARLGGQAGENVSLYHFSDFVIVMRITNKLDDLHWDIDFALCQFYPLSEV